MKVANHEKVAQSSRQSPLQARQRAEEWERRAREAETQLEVTQSKLDEVEQSHSQLDADYSLVKLQLEERDAEERLDKVCSFSETPRPIVLTSFFFRTDRTSCATRSPPWTVKSRVCKLSWTRPRRPLLRLHLLSCSRPPAIRMERLTLLLAPILVQALSTTTAVPERQRPSTMAQPTMSASSRHRNPLSGIRSTRPGVSRRSNLR